MNNAEPRKCSVYGCGKDAKLIGYVDKESGEFFSAVMSVDGNGKCRVLGGLLSGSLRKYRCPDDHESTNE